MLRGHSGYYWLVAVGIYFLRGRLLGLQLTLVLTLSGPGLPLLLKTLTRPPPRCATFRLQPTQTFIARALAGEEKGRPEDETLACGIGGGGRRRR